MVDTNSAPATPPALAFGTSTILAPADDARLSRLESALPRSQSGVRVYSGSASATPAAAAVLPSGLITPTGISATGSVFPFVVQGQFGFAWDGATLTVAWDGTAGSVPFVIRRADGTSFSVPRAQMSVAALKPATAYQFAAYVAVAQPGVVSFVAGDAGSPRFAFSPAATPASLLTAAQQQRLTVNEPLTAGLVTYTTGSAGTSASGGGSGSYTGADTGYPTSDPNAPGYVA